MSKENSGLINQNQLAQKTAVLEPDNNCSMGTFHIWSRGTRSLGWVGKGDISLKRQIGEGKNRWRKENGSES